MAGLKSLFRRKSKKNLRSETPTNDPPSPSRIPPSGSWTNSSRSQPASSPRTPGTHPPRSSTPGNLSSSSRAQPQDPSALVDSGSAPYENLPEGAAPERGTYPLHGNAAAFPTERRSSRSRSKAGSRSNSLRRSSIQSTPQIRSVPPGTAVTTDEYPSGRSASRASNYTDASRYSEDVGGQTIGQEIPPVPQPTIRSVTPANGNKMSKHERFISQSSVGSQKTPIADEFTSSQWYNQSGSPPIPSFSESHPPQDNSNFGMSTGPSPSGRNIGNVTPMRQYAQDPNATSLGARPGNTLFSSSRFNDVDMSTGARTPTETNRKEIPNGNQVTNGDSPLATKTRRTSIPKSSLEKPLPVPTELQQTASDNGPTVQHGLSQTLPIRETNRVEAPPERVVEPQISSRAPVKDVSRLKAEPTDADLERLRYLEGSPTVQSGKWNGGQGRSVGNVEVRSGPQQAYNRPYMVEGASSPPSLDGIVNLQNTTDTSTHVHYAPAILHETVLPHVHEIREEQITRDIVNHQIHHRILPVVDVQVLPAKHFVRTHDGPDAEWAEVPQAAIPGRANQHWVVAETVTKMIPGRATGAARDPRMFSARTFEGTTGDAKEYVNENGVPTTEETWVHPPRIAQAPIVKGITYPYDMD